MLAPTLKVRYNNIYQYFCIGCYQGNRVTVKSCDYSFWLSASHLAYHTICIISILVVNFSRSS